MCVCVEEGPEEKGSEEEGFEGFWGICLLSLVWWREEGEKKSREEEEGSVLTVVVVNVIDFADK